MREHRTSRRSRSSVAPDSRACTPCRIVKQREWSKSARREVRKGATKAEKNKADTLSSLLPVTSEWETETKRKDGSGKKDGRTESWWKMERDSGKSWRERETATKVEKGRIARTWEAERSGGSWWILRAQRGRGWRRGPRRRPASLVSTRPPSRRRTLTPRVSASHTLARCEPADIPCLCR